MINKGMFTSNTNEWATPQKFFDALNEVYHFSLDPCATPDNAKCKKYYTKEENGLLQNWKDEIVFCNPPYAREIQDWVKKCYIENKDNNTFIVLLIPARTDTKYFHEYIYHNPRVSIEFIKGRLKFNDGENPAPFPSMVVIFHNSADTLVDEMISEIYDLDWFSTDNIQADDVVAIINKYLK